MTARLGFEFVHANIVQAVKKCYKTKIDSGDLQRRFLRFCNPNRSFFYWFRASLHSNRLLLQGKSATVGEQKGYFCKAKGLQLGSKRTPFIIKWSFLWIVTIARSNRNPYNPLCINNISLHTQNSRISSQRFSCAFSSQFWAIKNANIVLLQSKVGALKAAIIRKKKFRKSETDLRNFCLFISLELLPLSS